MVVNPGLNQEGKEHLSVTIKVIKVQEITVKQLETPNQPLRDQSKQSITDPVQVPVKQEQFGRAQQYIGQHQPPDKVNINPTRKKLLEMHHTTC